MVINITNFARSGLYDWMAQRVSAVVIAAYSLFLIGYLFFGATPDYAAWHALFSQTWMRIFSLLALISIAVHAWVGMWTVTTDYLTTRLLGPKGTALRFGAQVVCGILNFVVFVWGVQVIWGF